MYGVALEGGGMKGAYHIGAIKALQECGYEIGGYVGTSIGAFNAAVIAQGDYKKLYDAWYNGSTALGIDVDEKELGFLVDRKWSLRTIKYWTKFLKDNIYNKGIDSTKLKQFYSKMIDEEKLRKSKLDFGLVTVSYTDKKPLYMYKEDIPENMVSSYVLASSYLPVFKQDKILKDEKFYLDGGFYDNCPITLLIDKGYKDIIEIKTGAIGKSKRVNRKNLNILTVEPSKDLGSIIFSDNKQARENIKMGYYDCLRVLKGYIGDKFYVIPEEDDKVFNMLLKLTDEQILHVVKELNINGITEEMEPKKILFEKMLGAISAKLKNRDISSYQKLIVSMIEYITENEIQIYKLYTFDELLIEIKKKLPKLIRAEKESIIKSQTNLLILNILKELLKNVEI